MFLLGLRVLIIGLIAFLGIWQLVKYAKKLFLIDNRREKLDEAITNINETLDEANTIPDSLKDKDIKDAKAKVNKVIENGSTN